VIVSTKFIPDQATAVCNAILVTQIFCYQYSIINNATNKQYF